MFLLPQAKQNQQQLDRHEISQRRGIFNVDWIECMSMCKTSEDLLSKEMSINYSWRSLVNKYKNSPPMVTIRCVHWWRIKQYLQNYPPPHHIAADTGTWPQKNRRRNNHRLKKGWGWYCGQPAAELSPHSRYVRTVPYLCFVVVVRSKLPWGKPFFFRNTSFVLWVNSPCENKYFLWFKNNSIFLFLSNQCCGRTFTPLSMAVMEKKFPSSRAIGNVDIPFDAGRSFFFG